MGVADGTAVNERVDGKLVHIFYSIGQLY